MKDPALCVNGIVRFLVAISNRSVLSFPSYLSQRSLLSNSFTFFREPLNNSLCPVSTRCISRNLHLVKAISVQNGHYFSAFLLLFLKKGRLPLYQVAESFRPAMASAYKLAHANIAYSRFSFFFKPRYTVFL